MGEVTSPGTPATPDLVNGFANNGSGTSPDRELDQPPVHGRVSRPSRRRWRYLDKPDLAMDQPVHARPHVQPILRDAGCAAIRADPQWQQTGTPQPEPRSPPRRPSGLPADDRQAAALGSRQAGFMSSFPGPDGRSAEPRRVMASGSATRSKGFSLTPFRLGGVNHQNM